MTFSLPRPSTSIAHRVKMYTPQWVETDLLAREHGAYNTMTSRTLAAVNVYPLKTTYQPSYINNTMDNTNLSEISSRENLFFKKDTIQREQSGTALDNKDDRYFE